MALDSYDALELKHKADRLAATSNDDERGEIADSLRLLIPPLEADADVPSLILLMVLPLAEQAGEALQHIGAPAVAPLLEIAARPGDPAQAAAYDALDKMWSSEAIPGLEEAAAGAPNEEVRRVAGELLQRQKGILDEIKKADEKGEGWGKAIASRGCLGPALLLIAVVVVVIAHF
jgi:hypothetical protein